MSKCFRFAEDSKSAKSHEMMFDFETRIVKIVKLTALNSYIDVNARYCNYD